LKTSCELEINDISRGLGSNFLRGPSHNNHHSRLLLGKFVGTNWRLDKGKVMLHLVRIKPYTIKRSVKCIVPIALNENL